MISRPGSRAGSRFGPYHLIRLLGRGGMGEVYEAEDTRKRRAVALKLISEQFSGDPTFRARMQREANTAGRLNEPHVVPIHDYGEINGQFYVEMRLIDGTDLSSLLKAQGAMDPPRAVAVVRQIAAALDAAHAAGVTHRDIKPENILVTPDDFAYLVDFGIARAASDPGLTQTGTAMGTYKYMAPERFSGDEVTYRADIYSLTCVLAECLTGSPPFRADSVGRAIGAHLTEQPPRPSQLRPGKVPLAMDQVIATGMAKNPEARYRTAGDLAAAAHAALTAPEQYQAARILQHGAEVTLGPPAADAYTMAGPRASGPGSASWRGPVPSYSGGQGGPAMYGQPPHGRDLDFAPAATADRNRHKPLMVAAAVVLAVLIVAVAGYLVIRGPQSSTSASGQTELPFNGLDFRLSPGAVALDDEGNVYAASEGMYGRVVKLPHGSNTPTVQPFNGLYQPQGLAIDTAGAMYVSDFNNRVVKLTSGSNDQTELPISGLNYPEGVAVDTGGNVYVADRGNNRVVKLAAGSNTQTDLPFDGLNHPDGVAVDPDGNVYVADTDNNRVVKLAAGSDAQSVLPFTGVSVPWGIAVDSSGAVYVTEHNKNAVLKLASGANAPTQLPFEGLNTPLDVTVGKDGTVYVADRGNNRVVKLAPS